MTSVGNITAVKGIVDLNASITPDISTSDADFGQYMQQSMNDQNTSVVTQSVQKAEVTSSDQKVSLQNNDSATAQSDQLQNEAVATEGTVSEEQVTTICQNIKDAVEEILEIDEMTLEAVLAQMGIVPVELMQPDNLQQFVLIVDGGQEPADFLMNEEMMTDFSLLSETLQSMDFTEITEVSMDSVLQQVSVMETEIPMESVVSEDGNPVVELMSEDPNEDLMIMVQSEDEKWNVSSQTYMNEPHVSSNQTDSTAVELDVDFQSTDSQGQSDANMAEQDSSGFMEQPAGEIREPVSDFVVTGNHIQQQFAVESVGETATPQPSSQMVQIVEQIVEQIRVNVQSDTTTLEMQLNPESLGKVLLTVSNKAGMMTASFTVQTEEARIALESQMYTLRENLEQKELKVEAVEVTVSNFEFTQSDESGDDQKNFNQGDGRSRRFRVEEQEEEETLEAEEAERVRRSVMRDNGSSIDFTA